MRSATPPGPSSQSHFDPAEMFELLFVVGGYLCLAAVLNSIGLQGGLPAAPRVMT